MASSHGQKVTSDPATQQNPKNENPGTVTSDSLAAESIQSGGSFAANSDARGPSAQPSYSTTTNTTDTSNATRLDPAPSADARAATEQWSEQDQLNAGNKLSSTEASTGRVTGGYAAGAVSGGQPKGQNLQEGGFDSGAPNASFTTDIGGKNDPGRVGLNEAQLRDVPVSGGAGARAQEVNSGGQFDTLDETSA